MVKPASPAASLPPLLAVVSVDPTICFTTPACKSMQGLNRAIGPHYERMAIIIRARCRGPGCFKRRTPRRMFAILVDAAPTIPQADGGDEGCMATSDAGFGGLLGLTVLLGLGRRRRRR